MNGLADRHRRHHDVGRPPAALLGDLVGDGLLALVLVGVAGGAAVEEQPILDQPIPDRDQVVVPALIEHEILGGGRHLQELGRRGAGVGEDQRAQAGPGRVRRDRRAGVARGHHRGGAEAELQRGGHRRGGRAILHGAGRIGALELQAQSSHPQPGGQARRIQERCAALAERHPVGRIRDGQHRRVAPEAGSGQRRRAVAPQAIEVVGELQQPAALRALETVAERKRRAALDAGQVADERGDHRPNRSRTSCSISSTRWRSVCSVSARRRALSPMARASSGWARWKSSVRLSSPRSR